MILKMQKKEVAALEKQAKNITKEKEKVDKLKARVATKEKKETLFKKTSTPQKLLMN